MRTNDFLFNAFRAKFRTIAHPHFTDADEAYAYASDKFAQYATELEQEHGLTSEELDDGAEWYDELHDEVIACYVNILIPV